jgi:hypothetical protein
MFRGERLVRRIGHSVSAGVAPQTQAHGSRLLADVAIEIAELHIRSGEPIQFS